MQNFTKINRIELKKRAVTERIKDFKEIYELRNFTDTKEQASRCIQCGNPYCNNKCPLNNFIPFWLKAISKKDLELAFNISNETNPFPEITGRVCPQEKLCEGECSLSSTHGAISIGSIEVSITENGFKHGYTPKFSKNKNGKSVALIGSGPASISAASYLLRAGFEVNMYEKQAKAGGLLTYGIPNFKIEKNVIQRRIEFLLHAGLNLHVNTEVGKDISFDDILNSNNAVFLGIGSEESNSANVLNENAKGTFFAIDFLKDIQKKQFDEKQTSKYNIKNKKTIVIGGGDTAMDCLRTLIREGSKNVTCLYRRDKSSMPCSKREFKNAIDEGAQFIYNVAVKDIITNSENQVIGVNLLKTISKEKDSSGKQSIEIIKSSDFSLEADIIIFALGFKTSIPRFLVENGIETDRHGNILICNYQTSKSGVYAGGDCVNGSDLVVKAAADGKNAAMQIIKDVL